MSKASGLVPSVIVLAAALLTALPWGLDSDLRFVLPQCVCALVYTIALHRPRSLPAVVVFAAGLAIDVMSGAPLGYWALVLLAACAIGLSQRSAAGGALALTGQSLVALALLTALQWAVAALYYLHWPHGQPYLMSALAAAPVYVLLTCSLRPQTGSAGAVRRELA